MNSDEDKVYTKIVAFDEIYNFVVQTFSFEVIFGLKKSIYYQDLSLRYPDLDSIYCSVPTAVPGGDRSLPPFTMAVGGYFCKFLDPLYIFRKS
jgi:hypothetical protein